MGPGSVAEPFDVVSLRARQQIEKGVETSIEGAPQLWHRAVDGVKRETAGRIIGQRQSGFLEAL